MGECIISSDLNYLTASLEDLALTRFFFISSAIRKFLILHPVKSRLVTCKQLSSCVLLDNVMPFCTVLFVVSTSPALH